MEENSREAPVCVRVQTRRDVLLCGLAASVCLSLIGRLQPAAAGGAAASPERSQQFAEALDRLLKGATPAAERIMIELPEIAENGNGVSFSLSVESPMTAESHVKAVHLLSTGNPQALVATYRFSPINAKAQTTGRMRLARTQDVVVIAELSTGELLIGERNVKVTIGGCGN